MARSVSAAEANRTFSAVLREVRAGETIIVTSHGRPVARIVPFDAADETRGSARELLFNRLRAMPVVNAGRWTRDELHKR